MQEAAQTTPAPEIEKFALSNESNGTSGSGPTPVCARAGSIRLRLTLGQARLAQALELELESRLDGRRVVRGRLGRQERALKGAALYNVELDVKTPGS